MPYNGTITPWMQKLFPKATAASLQEFGWRIYEKKCSWQNPPARLPEHQIALLMQGLDDTGKIWMNLAPALTDDGWTVFELRYPNDQPIENSTTYLFYKIKELQASGIKSFVLIGHSMGGIIARNLLSSPVFHYKDCAKSGTFPTCRYLIQIGPPNHGSSLAHMRFISEWREHLYKLSKGQNMIGLFLDGNGEAGNDLLPGSPFMQRLNQQTLPKEIPVTIIAGVIAPVSNSSLFNTWKLWQRQNAIQSEDQEINPQLLNKFASALGDGAVPLQSTPIKDVKDYHVFQSNHQHLVRNFRNDSNRIPPAIPIIQQRLRSLLSNKGVSQ